MGYYYNPPDEIATKCRPANRWQGIRDRWLPRWWLHRHSVRHVNIAPGRRIYGSAYEYLRGQLHGDEELFGLYDNLAFKAAPWLFSEEEFAAHEAAYAQGHAVTRAFYAVSRNAAKPSMDYPDCFDGA